MALNIKPFFDLHLEPRDRIAESVPPDDALRSVLRELAAVPGHRIGHPFDGHELLLVNFRLDPVLVLNPQPHLIKVHPPRAQVASYS